MIVTSQWKEKGKKWKSYYADTFFGRRQICKTKPPTNGELVLWLKLLHILHLLFTLFLSDFVETCISSKGILELATVSTEDFLFCTVLFGP